jgi:hypothetical protein
VTVCVPVVLVLGGLQNFKPSSGLLHHFYNVFIYNPSTCDELFAHRWVPAHFSRATDKKAA